MPTTDDRSAWFEGQGLWQHIPETDWLDWTWQLKNRLTSVEQLERHMELTAAPGRGLDRDVGWVGVDDHDECHPACPAKGRDALALEAGPGRRPRRPARSLSRPRDTGLEAGR